MQAIPNENTKEYVLIIHDVRSAQNVGSLFRSADAIGVSKIYLSSITPGPVDRFGRARSDIAKTALGAEKTIRYEHYDDIVSLLQKYKSEGFTIIAIEQSSSSIDYKKVEKKDLMVFILGNEVGGIPVDILSMVDIVAEIPMKGKKESLNVSVAGGVALFRILDK